MKAPYRFILILLMVIGAGFGASAATPAGPETLFDVRVGEATVSVVLALTGPEQQKGLMYRGSLPINRGMLFIYKRPARMGFWMKNTSIPLSIGFFNAQGVLREIHPLHPNDLTTVESDSNQIQYALEVNRGWFQDNKIHIGDKIKIKDVRKALQARGYPGSILNGRNNSNSRSGHANSRTWVDSSNE